MQIVKQLVTLTLAATVVTGLACLLYGCVGRG